MKKTLIALSIFAFLGSTAVAGVYATQDNSTAVEMTDGGKDKKKKKKCADDCAKECCTADAKAKAKTCSKDAKKSCCSKDKKKADK